MIYWILLDSVLERAVKVQNMQNLLGALEPFLKRVVSQVKLYHDICKDAYIFGVNMVNLFLMA